MSKGKETERNPRGNAQADGGKVQAGRGTLEEVGSRPMGELYGCHKAACRHERRERQTEGADRGSEGMDRTADGVC